MSKKVLIVDDSPFIYDEITSFLSDTDFEIIGHAKNGEEAFEMYDKFLPDVVTMDIIMPGLSGLEVSERILSRWKDANIIMISSLAYDETIDKAASLGIKHFIFKPIEPDELIKALNEMTK